MTPRSGKSDKKEDKIQKEKDKIEREKEALRDDWNTDTKVVSTVSTEVFPTLIRVRTKIPGKKDSFSLRPLVKKEDRGKVEDRGLTAKTPSAPRQGRKFSDFFLLGVLGALAV